MNHLTPSVSPFLSCAAEAFCKPVCRLGLASHGQTAITPDDVLYAVERGVNFLNWPGEADSPGADAFSDASLEHRGGADIRLKERFRGDQVRETSNSLSNVAAAIDLDRLVSDHERSRLVIDVDEKAVGTVIRFEERTNRRTKRFVVSGNHEHGDSFAIILRGADD